MFRRKGDTFLMGLNENGFVIPKDGWNFGGNKRFGEACVLIH
jgi:hypothetical protein